MIPPAELVAALASPSVESWRKIASAGSAIMRAKDTNVFFKMEYATFSAALRKSIRHWPPELQRRCPDDWSLEWKEIAEHLIKETQTYGYYEAGVCGDPRLKLKDGTQGVRLERRFVGASRSIVTNQIMKSGTKGEPDLSGGMTIEVPNGFRFEVTVGLEVKGPEGSLRPEQEQRIRALRRRGGIAVVARTVEEAVLVLVEAKREILKKLAA